MNCLPIVKRELLVQARRPATFRLRMAVALLALLISLPFLSGIRPVRTAGKPLFEAQVTALLCLVGAACFLSADGFSRELREGTLPLLLQTRVRNIDLVLGKLASSSLAWLCAMAAIFPVLALCLLIGGVTAGEVVRKGLALANALCLSVSIGLLASSTSDRFLTSARRAAILIGIISLVPLWPWEFAASWWRWFGLLSPLTAVISGTDYAYHWGRGATGFWGCILVVQAEAWFAIYATSLLIGRGCRIDSLLKLFSRTVRHLPLTAEAEEPKRIRWKPAQDNVNPFAWLVRRRGALRPAFYTAAVIIAGVQPMLIPLVFQFFRPAATYLWFQLPSFALALLSSGLIAWGVTSPLIRSRMDGELELLLTTPLGAGQVISGHWEALKHELRWPVVIMLIPSAARLLIPVMPGFYMPMYAMLSIGTIICSVLAVCWTGLLYAARGYGQSAAVGWTLFWCKVLPYLGGTLFLSPILSGFGTGMLPIQVLIIGYHLLLVRIAKGKLAASR